MPFDERSLRFIETYPAITYHTPHLQQDTDGAYIGWVAPSSWVFNLGGRDVSGHQHVTFRLAQALTAGLPPSDPRNPPATTKNLRVALKDLSGQSAVVDLASFAQTAPYPYVRNDAPASGLDPAFAESNTKSAFTSVRIPLWAFSTVTPSIDLAQVTELRLMLDGTGLVVIDDIEFSS